jgi:ESS family glutamate:Na+ symporter
LRRNPEVEPMQDIHVTGADVVVVSILVLVVGNILTRKIRFLDKYSIPAAVTGGFLCSALVAAVVSMGGPQFTFDMQIRDLLLLVFFSTIGLSAKFSRLKAGGKALALLTVCAFVLLVLQNTTGVLMARLFGAHPGLGLFGGSVSLAGGHGIAGGFCGLGLGATPVAIANMSAVTQEYGPSFKAFLVVPLVGAFFVDLLNALVIKFFLGLPMMQTGTSPGL